MGDLMNQYERKGLLVLISMICALLLSIGMAIGALTCEKEQSLEIITESEKLAYHKLAAIMKERRDRIVCSQDPVCVHAKAKIMFAQKHLGLLSGNENIVRMR